MIFDGEGGNLSTMNMRMRSAALALLAIIVVSCNPAKKYEEEEKVLFRTMCQRMVSL